MWCWWDDEMMRWWDDEMMRWWDDEMMNDVMMIMKRGREGGRWREAAAMAAAAGRRVGDKKQNSHTGIWGINIYEADVMIMYNDKYVDEKLCIVWWKICRCEMMWIWNEYMYLIMICWMRWGDEDRRGRWGMIRGDGRRRTRAGGLVTKIKIPIQR